MSQCGLQQSGGKSFLVRGCRAGQQGRAGQSHVLVGKTSNWDCSLTEQQKLGFPTRAIVCRYKTRGNTAKDELTRTKKCAGHEAEACGALMSACGAINSRSQKTAILFRPASSRQPSPLCRQRHFGSPSATQHNLRNRIRPRLDTAMQRAPLCGSGGGSSGKVRQLLPRMEGQTRPLGC